MPARVDDRRVLHSIRTQPTAQPVLTAREGCPDFSGTPLPSILGLRSQEGSCEWDDILGWGASAFAGRMYAVPSLLKESGQEPLPGRKVLKVPLRSEVAGLFAGIAGLGTRT